MDFRAVPPAKKVFYVGGQNTQKMKIQDSHIVENLISFVLTPFAYDLFQHSLICDRYS